MTDEERKTALLRAHYLMAYQKAWDAGLTGFAAGIRQFFWEHWPEAWDDAKWPPK